MLRFMDINTSIGVWKHPNYGGYETVNELENILDHFQVESAVVYHAQAHETIPAVGNRMLMDELKGKDRLLPSWVIFPNHTDEMPEPEELLDEMITNDVRIARLLPGYDGNRFCMEPWSSGSLLGELQKHKIPTLIDFMFFRRDDPDWKLVYDLCQLYPELPIILTGWSGLASRSFFALCKVCPNLYLDTSRYSLFRGIEAFCSQVGASQLIYGSGMPRMTPGSAMTTITHAFISKDEKQMIAMDNLQRLLGEVS